MFLGLLVAAVAVAHHPHDPIEVFDVARDASGAVALFAGLVPNQTWRNAELGRSVDGGFEWDGVHIGLTSTSPYVDFRVSPTFAVDGTAVLVTESEAFVSTDHLQTWAEVAVGRFASCAVVDGAGGPVLVLGDLAGQVWVSTDHGAEWRITDAATGPARRLTVAGARVAFVDDVSVAESGDGGETWVHTPLAQPSDVVLVPDGLLVATEAGVLDTRPDSAGFLPGYDGPAYRVAVPPDDPDGGLVFVTRVDEQAVFVSRDGGARFDRVDTPRSLSPQDPYHWRHVRFSPDFERDGRVWIATFEGLLASEDHGRTWTHVHTRDPGLITSIAVSNRHADDGLVLLTTYDATTYLSEDGGDTFRPFTAGLVRESTYASDIHHAADGTLSVFAGHRNQLLLGQPPFDAWTPLPGIDDRATPYPSVMALSATFEDDATLVVGTRYPGGFASSTDGGVSWSPWLEVPYGVSRIAFSADGGAVLAGAQGGQTYLAPDRGFAFEEGPACVGHAPVWVAPYGDGWFLGCADGGFTTDGVDLEPVADLPQPLNQVATAPDGTRYAVELGGRLLRSDAGGPFRAIGAELLAAGVVFNELTVSPTHADDGTLFGASGRDLFRSVDRGETWQHVGPDPVRYEDRTWRLRWRGAPPMRLLDGDASTGAMTLLVDGGSVDLDFSGSGVTWLGGPGIGRATVTLDGAVVAEVDTDAAAPRTERWAVSGLDPGPHVLQITAGFGRVAVDAFDVYRPLDALDGAAGTGGTGTGTGTATGTGGTASGTGTGTGGTTPGTGTAATGTGTATGSDATVDTAAPGDSGSRRRPKDGCACAAAGGSGLAGWPLALLVVGLRRRR